MRVSVSYRIEEKYLEMLKAIAEKEERSQTAIFQIMIRERAEKLGVKKEIEKETKKNQNYDWYISIKAR